MLYALQALVRALLMSALCWAVRGDWDAAKKLSRLFNEDERGQPERSEWCGLSMLLVYRWLGNLVGGR